MKFFQFLLTFSLFVSLTAIAQTADQSDWEGGYADGCTSITLGKLATADGSVITSHTDDSHRTRSWIDIMPPKKHKKGDVCTHV